MKNILTTLVNTIKGLFSDKDSTDRIIPNISSNNSKPNIQQLLASSDNNSIIELDNYICALCEWGDNLSVLTDPQRTFYFNQEFEREINNGGFSQYFNNSSGMYANETLATLKKIGAHKTAEILQAAINFFPNQQVPIDQGKRQDIIAEIETEISEPWENLDQQFFKYEDDLHQLNMEFVKNNQDQF